MKRISLLIEVAQLRLQVVAVRPAASTRRLPQSRQGGIYLTQVAYERGADRQGLPGLVRGAADVVPRRGCVLGLP